MCGIIVQRLYEFSDNFRVLMFLCFDSTSSDLSHITALCSPSGHEYYECHGFSHFWDACLFANVHYISGSRDNSNWDIILYIRQRSSAQNGERWAQLAVIMQTKEEQVRGPIHAKLAKQRVMTLNSQLGLFYSTFNICVVSIVNYHIN